MIAPPAQRGFILVATLWTLAGLVLLAGYIHDLVAADRERAELTRQTLEYELDARGTTATLLYLLATSRMDHLGLILEREGRGALGAGAGGLPGYDVLEVTGQAYFGMGRVRFSLQDETALASVNMPDVMLAAAFEHVGLAAEDINWLMPRIADYIDLDRAVRLDGAERYDYTSRDLAPPKNWFMTTPLEIKKVLGADELLTTGQWRTLRRVLTARLKNSYNVNTMSPAALAVLLDGDENAVRRILEVRAEQPVSNVQTIIGETGRSVPLPEDVLMLPSRVFRLALWRPDDGMRSLVGITLTPGSVFGPWRKEYSYAEPVDDDAAPAIAAATPLFQSS